MDMDDELVALVGNLVQILHVEHTNQTVHCRLQDGRATRFTINSGDLPERGDIILLGENRWEPAPSEAWLVNNFIAVVRQVLDEGDVLIDDGLSLKRIKNDDQVSISRNNTIEYNDLDGIVGVLSEKPIRSREYGADSKEILEEYMIDTSGEGPSFEDFGGYPHVIERARELIETQFNSREYLDKIGARPLKGVLFSGPPGTGKTHLARIIAHSSKAEFFLVSGPSIVSKWVGDSEETLRKIFEAAIASKSGRAIVFFDEIDSIAERRSGDTHEASKRLVAQLLTLMDGFDDKGKSVVVIAATNRVETLDPALMRPGRFDWEIEFGKPSAADRNEILRVGARQLKTKGELPFDDIAALTEGWSSAELTSLWSEAALLAAGDTRDSIAAEDMAQAYERVAGRPRHQASNGDVI